MTTLQAVGGTIDVQAEMIHRDAIVLDGHLDVLVSTSHPLLRLPGGASHADLNRLQDGQVNAVVLSIAAQVFPRTAEGNAQARAEAAEKLETIRAFIRDSAGRAELALTAADLRRVVAAGRIAVLIGFQNAQHLAHSLEDLDTLYADGVRLFDFTHAGNNDFADSSRAEVEEHGGLSAVGRKAVAKLNALGILIDVSQLTASGVRQVVELSRAPVIASHSAIRALADVPRNLADSELDAIGSSGGLVSIPAFGRYLTSPPPDYDRLVADVRARFGLSQEGPRNIVYRGYEMLPESKIGSFFEALTALWPGGDLQTFVDHIDYAVQRIGIDHVGIGNDFNHGGGIAGFEDLSRAGAVTRELVARGYSKSDIAKIWGENFLRVLDTAQELAER